MKKKWKILILILVLLNTLLISTVEAQGKGKKLRRGTINTLTGWIEIPKNIYNTTVEENRLSGVTKGFISGLGMAIIRTGCGMYEVITFPFSVPKGCQPILIPEYVIDTSWFVTMDDMNTKENNIYTRRR